MKKPEKRKCTVEQTIVGISSCRGNQWQVCRDCYRNQTIDDYEKFLPSEKEILKIISEVYSNLGNDGVDDSDLAKAISKRIGGKK